MNETLHIEKQFSSCGMTTYLIEGFTPQEMDSILKSESWETQRDRLAILLNSHENDLRNGKNIGTCWKCGYGIYNIRHFGGNLLVTIGNSCD